MQNVGPAAFTARTACAENLTVFSTLKRTRQAMKRFVRSEDITVASMRTVKSAPTIQKNPQYMTCKILTYLKKQTMNAEIMISQLLKSTCQLNQPKKFLITDIASPVTFSIRICRLFLSTTPTNKKKKKKHAY